MRNKWKLSVIVCIIALMLFNSSLCVNVYAEESASDSLGYNVSLSNSVTGVGKEVTLTISLTNFNEHSEQIRGLQIDINNVDNSILTVVSYGSLITDPTAVSNTASYSEANSRLRLLYANFTGTLPVNSDNNGSMPVYQVKFKINESLETAGEVILPITVKFQTVNNRITQNSSCVIKYDIQENPFCSVDLSWTSMNFTYSDGAWNPQTHQYGEGTWQSNNDESTICVKNVGEIAVSASFSYTSYNEYRNITGVFSRNDVMVSSIGIGIGKLETVSFVPKGRPNNYMENAKIGTITVTIAHDE